MIRIASIVEGDGEVEALPVLLRRLAYQSTPHLPVNPLRPIRVRRERFLNKDEEFRKQVLLAAARSGEDGWMLIVLDADDDCPVTLASAIAERAKAYVPHRRVSVVLAQREFEAWFIAAALSLEGFRGFSLAQGPLVDAEVPRDAKGWLRERMQGGTYSPIRDQPAFASRMDLQQASERSRSFRKLCAEWQAYVARISN